MEQEESPSEAGAPAAPAIAEGAPPRPEDSGRPEGRFESRGGGGRRPGGGGGGGRRGGFIGRRKVCAFCVDKIEKIDYKEPMKLRRFVSDRGKIEPRRKTGTCARHQRRLTIALKRARHLALLPYTSDHIRTSNVFPARTAADRREG